MKHLILILSIIIVGCSATKKATETAESISITTDGVDNVHQRASTEHSITSTLSTNTDEIITETFYSLPDTAGATHIVRTIQTKRYTNNTINGTTNAKETSEQTSATTIKSTQIGKTENKTTKIDSNPTCVLALMVALLATIIFVVYKLRKM
jgi:hypothetical protein